MTQDDPPRPDRQGTGIYEIRIAGRLDPRRAAWFDGLTPREAGDGTTVIGGPVADQAALHGLLQRVRDLGIPLVSVTRTHDLAAGPAGEAPLPTIDERTTT